MAYNNPLPGFGKTEWFAFRKEQLAKGRTTAQITAQWRRRKETAAKRTDAQSPAVQQMALALEVGTLIDETFGPTAFMRDFVGAGLMTETYPGCVEFYIPTSAKTGQSKYANPTFIRKLRAIFAKYPAVQLKIAYIPAKKSRRARA